jgi:alcohol dehydrogenase
VVAIYDPDLTASTPPRVLAETGMNALAHCVEAAYSPHRTPEAEAIALAGARTIHTALSAVVADPSNGLARAAALEGAALAGRCLLNASMGVHHGLSQLVGGRTGIPHGLANAILLTHSIAFNADVVEDEVARLSAAFGSEAEEAVDRLRATIGLPGRLSEVGVDEADLEVVARLSQSNANVGRNPRPVGEADALAILRAAY